MCNLVELVDVLGVEDINKTTISNLNKLAVYIESFENEPSEKNRNKLFDTMLDLSLNIEELKILHCANDREFKEMLQEKITSKLMKAKYEEVAADIDLTKGKIVIDLKTDEEVANVLKIVNEILRRG